MSGLPVPSETRAESRADGAGDREGTATAAWRVHLLVLVLCLGLLGVAFLLEPVAPGDGERIAVAGVTLPEVCTFKETLGLPCPGCGLTRSWVSALHGDLGNSLAHHSLGWLVLLYAAAQAARHGAWLAIPAGRRAIEATGRWLDRGVILLGGFLLLAWIPTLVRALTG